MSVFTKKMAHVNVVNVLLAGVNLTEMDPVPQYLRSSNFNSDSMTIFLINET